MSPESALSRLVFALTLLGVLALAPGDALASGASGGASGPPSAGEAGGASVPADVRSLLDERRSSPVRAADAAVRPRGARVAQEAPAGPQTTPTQETTPGADGDEDEDVTIDVPGVESAESRAPPAPGPAVDPGARLPATGFGVVVAVVLGALLAFAGGRLRRTVRA